MKAYIVHPNVPPNPHLFPMFWETWANNGCDIVNSIKDADVFFIDLHTRISNYNQREIDYVCSSDKPTVSWDEFDKGGLSNWDWPEPLTSQQRQVFEHIEKNNIKSVHFCRLLNKTKAYPINVFPYEKPFLYCEPPATPEQLFNRRYDVVWIANTAPQREMFKRVLEEDGRLKTKIILGAEKIPLQSWIDAHKEGKMFVSWSAGGWTDEKMHHLFSVAAMIKENNNQLLLHDFVNGEHCLRPNPTPTKEDIDAIVDVVNDKEKLYNLYINAYNFIKEYYSAEYIANFILKKIKCHTTTE